MTIGKTRLTLVMVPGVFFLLKIFSQIWNLNMKNSGDLKSSFDWPIFQKKILQFRHFRNFRNCDPLENSIALFAKLRCLSKIKMGYLRNCDFFAIAIRNYRNFRNSFYNSEKDGWIKLKLNLEDAFQIELHHS